MNTIRMESVGASLYFGNIVATMRLHFDHLKARTVLHGIATFSNIFCKFPRRNFLGPLGTSWIFFVKAIRGRAESTDNRQLS